MTKCIFVTGGASGIGRAIAIRFAREGWFVALADVDSAGMAQTGALLPAGRWSAHLLDVRDAAGWDIALGLAAAAGGGAIHVVANNAGVPLGGALAQCTVDEIERVIAINLTGATLGARAAYPWLKAAAGQGACLLNTASAAALYGTPGTSVYAATKAGLRALTEALDAEWAGDGIAVRSLMPGFIATPLLEHAPNAATPGTITDAVVRQGLEIGTPDAVAEAAWQAVHGPRLHMLVGPTARRLAFAARWLPGTLRRRLRRGGGTATA
ncbi:SDR family oxidoreductase [Novosphingobium capsulatum]|uniref:SDR family oxidoreductase n=1 Tax=Novosphingobium capsulatum TaxID=13688 RepID=UPI0007888383|nr:SDR family oxidoreductase [Novosphingobium capsulatum]WQD94410.1 SDR family oxidoreductase [Novosphingobium capsulatum]